MKLAVRAHRGQLCEGRKDPVLKKNKDPCGQRQGGVPPGGARGDVSVPTPPWSEAGRSPPGRGGSGGGPTDDGGPGVSVVHGLVEQLGGQDGPVALVGAHGHHHQLLALLLQQPGGRGGHGGLWGVEAAAEGRGGVKRC